MFNNNIPSDELDDSDPFDEFANATLEFAIDEAEYLFNDDKAFHFGVINMAGGVEYITFSREDVAATDRRLPEVIDALTKDNGVDAAAGCLLRNTIEHWNNPPPIIRTVDTISFHLHSVQHIYPMEKAGTLKIQGFVYKMKKTKSGQDYCPEGEHEILKLDEDWLDTYYPGALNRLQAAQLLELDGEDLRDYVFTNPDLSSESPVLPTDLDP